MLRLLFDHHADGAADPGDGTHPGVIKFDGHHWEAIAEAVENNEQLMITDEVAEPISNYSFPTSGPETD